VGFGAELLLMLLLGFLLLGPRQMHALLGHVARAKALLGEAKRTLKSQLTTDFEAPSKASKPEPPPRLIQPTQG
jgi:Sec-independent protein translocase protein TatA